MDSNLLITTHLIAVNAFLLLYLVKGWLLFRSPERLDRLSRQLRIPEMIIGVLFLLSGIWLFSILGAIKSFQIVKLALVTASIPLAVISFKRHRKGMAVAAVLLLVAAYGISEAGKGRPYLAARVEAGGDITGAVGGIVIYAAHCSPCHGADGRKQYRGAADLSTSRMERDMASAVIASGVKRGRRGTMPAFAGQLSALQVAAVTDYIQDLKN